MTRHFARCNNLTERVIEAIVRQEGLTGLASAMNNVFVHGELFKELDMELDDADVRLGRVYEATEELIAVGKELEGWVPTRVRP